MIYAGLLAMMLADGNNLATSVTELHTFSAISPSYKLVVGNGRAGADYKEIFHVELDGHIILGPGVSLDEASLAFWQAVEQMAPGKCKEIIKEKP